MVSHSGAVLPISSKRFCRKASKAIALDPHLPWKFERNRKKVDVTVAVVWNDFVRLARQSAASQGTGGNVPARVAPNGAT